MFFIIIGRLIDIKILKYDNYYETYQSKTNNNILGETAPRGRILDTNGKVLVDNVAINNIIYRKSNNIKINDEISMAYKLSNILELNTKATNMEMKLFYILNNNTDYLITDKEKEDYDYRKITSDELLKIKLDRLNDEINIYNEEDDIAIHTFYLMQKDYKTATKIIENDVSDDYCAKITEENMNGISCAISWKRVNNYAILDSIVGSVGPIPEEEKDNYLNAGYTSNDQVGISGLEKYYDSVLKGSKAIYEVRNDNSLKLVKDEVKGSDLVLSIDIDIEQYAEEVLKTHLLLAHKMQNTEYYNHAYIIVGNPLSGEILTIAGLRRNEDDSFTDISANALLSSYTVGSVVKGASHTVGYLNNLIDIGKKINDSCVKLYSVPEKCSFKRLGMIDDITSLKTSSNYYQFMTAIKSTGNTYKPNIKIHVTEDNFNTYRDIFKLYGLGSTTGIDYPKESTGIKGNIIAPDLLLNLAIGQYDSYTPLELLAYINTIAMKGNRYSLSFKKQQNKEIAKVNLDSEYYDRIQEGFYEVVNSGTGHGYTDTKYNAAGKTGTSEVYYDAKTTTITQSYIMYAPYDNPRLSLVVVNPNISYNNNRNNYIAPINRLISRTMSDYLLANY